MSLEQFVSENPNLSSAYGLQDTLSEMEFLRRRNKRLERFKSLLQALLDDQVAIEAFKAAIADVVEPKEKT